MTHGRPPDPTDSCERVLVGWAKPSKEVLILLDVQPESLFAFSAQLKFATLRQDNPLESLYCIVRCDNLNLRRNYFTPVPR